MVIPVPDIAIVRSVFPSLSRSKMFPVATPGELGPNDAVKLLVCPAESVSGVERPATLNPGPVKLAELTVALVAPGLLRVTVMLVFAPMLTFPKLIDEGVEVS